MKQTRLAPFAAAAIAIAPWLVGHAQVGLWPSPGSDPASVSQARYVLTDREAFLSLPPELVAAPTVLRTHWSPDARYVLAVRQEVRLAALDGRPPEGETSLLVWNRRARRSTTVWKQPLGGWEVREVAWLPGTAVALAVLRNALPPGPAAPGRTARGELLRIDAARGAARAIALFGEVAEDRLFVSPTHPLAVLLRRQTHEERGVQPDGGEIVRVRHEVSLRVVQASGSLGPAVPLPEQVHHISWTADGRPITPIPGPGPPSTPSQPQPVRLGELDLVTGAIRPLDTRPALYTPREPDLPVRLAQTTVALGSERGAERVQPLWLENATPEAPSRALLCADSPGGTLASDGSGVLYLSQGAAWVTPLLRVPKQAFLEARRAAFRAVAISNAKQIGLALLMYSQDYDEVFPPADERIVERLMPYAKLRELFHDPSTGAVGFLYLRPATTLKEIANPAQTPIGHLTGPGGRAVIYADGHVRWEEE